MDQLEEFENSFSQRRMPNCVHCQKPLLSISMMQGTTVRWRWNQQIGNFVKRENPIEWSAKPQCDSCLTQDWSFVDNGYLEL